MNWALIGASSIAGQYMTGAIRAQAAGEVGWVVSGNADRAAAFAESHGIAKSSTDLASALADDAAQAVYISSTNDKHHARAMAATVTDGLKSPLVADALRVAAQTGTRQAVDYGVAV